MIFRVESSIIAQSLVYLSLIGLAGAQCESGWIGTTEVGCYQFLTTQPDLSWFDAKVQCEIAGGYLAEIKTESASNFVVTIAALFPEVERWFIGLTDLVVEGTWKWFLSQETAIYTAWATGSPDNTTHNALDCAYLTISNNVGTWMDASCTTPVLGSAPLCEYAGASLTTASTTAIATVTATTSTASTTTATTCVNGWTAYGGSCYKFYLVANPKGSTWYESESYCVEAGGHLTSVHSVEEENFIEALAKSYNGQEQTFWMGAKPTVLEETWEWIDGSAWDYSNFINDDETASLGKCLMQYAAYYDDTLYGWSSLDCSREFYFVCKI